jgi:predicted outer membrane repeat protein
LTQGSDEINFESCQFIGNSADNGGAVYYDNNPNCPLYFTNCLFEGNSANTLNGGAIWLSNLDELNINRCVFSANTAVYNAGAIYAELLYDYQYCEIINSVFYDNQAPYAGGASGLFFSAGSSNNRIVAVFSDFISLQNTNPIIAYSGTEDMNCFAACVFYKADNTSVYHSRSNGSGDWFQYCVYNAQNVGNSFPNMSFSSSQNFQVLNNLFADLSHPKGNDANPTWADENDGLRLGSGVDDAGALNAVSGSISYSTVSIIFDNYKTDITSRERPRTIGAVGADPGAYEYYP